MTKFAVILGFAGALALVGCGSDDNTPGGDPGADLSSCYASCESIFANVPSSKATCRTQCEQNNDNPNNPPPVTLMDSGVDNNDDAAVTPPRNCGSLAYPLDQLGAKGVCAAETATCISACTDQACLNACLDNDTGTPATYMGQELGCDFCISNQTVACLEANGCKTETDALACCYADAQATCAAKPAGEQQACIQNACSTQNAAIGTCFQAKAGAACGDVTGASYTDCYAAAVTP